MISAETSYGLLEGATLREFKAADPVAETLPDGRVRLPGEMAVDDAAALLDTIWETDGTTVGGLVAGALGHLPAAGEVVTIGDFEFEVERVVERAVESVIVQRMTAKRDEARE